MKKFSFLLSILVGVLFLTGCTGSDFQDDPVMEMIVGILSEQSSGDDLAGSHIITNKEDNDVAVRSLSLNLSRENYLGNEVQALGFYNSEDGVFEITGLSVLSIIEEVSAEVEFALYGNTDLGFEINYYDNWELSDSADEVSFVAPDLDDNGLDTDSVEITQFIFDYTPKISEEGEVDTPLISFMAAYYPEVNDLGEMMSKIGIDALDAVELDSDDGTDYFLYRNGLVYQISFIPSPSKPLSENAQAFNEMIRSFRFTGFTVDEPIEESDLDEEDGFVEEDAADEDEDESVVDFSALPAVDMNFTRFESLPYHFSAEYPASWYYSGSSSSDSNVKHHYGFSDEAVEDGNPELISLDVISGAIPSGQKLNISGLDATKVNENGGVSLYVTVDGQNYRISGDLAHEAIMMTMVSSILPVERDEE